MLRIGNHYSPRNETVRRQFAQLYRSSAAEAWADAAWLALVYRRAGTWDGAHKPPRNRHCTVLVSKSQVKGQVRRAAELEARQAGDGRRCAEDPGHILGGARRQGLALAGKDSH